MKDLLKLIEVHCPRPNLCCSSPYFLKGMLSPSSTFIQCQKYCSSCFSEVTEDSVNKCSSCNRVLEMSHFLQISLEEQIKCLFKSKVPSYVTCMFVIVIMFLYYI